MFHKTLQGQGILLQTGERGTGARGFGAGGGGGGGAGPGPRGLSPAAMGPNWLQRGTTETSFDFTINPSVRGRPPSISLQYRGQRFSVSGGFSTNNPSSTARFKHLFTPESLIMRPAAL